MTTVQGPAGGPDALRAGRHPVPAPAACPHDLRVLSAEQCFALLEPGGIGRVGFTAAGAIMMLPVNFAVTGKVIVFRTAPDTLLALCANAPVSFEADHLDEVRREGWSVLVQGRARQVTAELEVQHLENRAHLQPWVTGARDVYLRITPARISGRRIQSG